LTLNTWPHFSLNPHSVRRPSPRPFPSVCLSRLSSLSPASPLLPPISRTSVFFFFLFFFFSSFSFALSSLLSAAPTSLWTDDSYAFAVHTNSIGRLLIDRAPRARVRVESASGLLRFLTTGIFSRLSARSRASISRANTRASGKLSRCRSASPIISRARTSSCGEYREEWISNLREQLCAHARATGSLLIATVANLVGLRNPRLIHNKRRQ